MRTTFVKACPVSIIRMASHGFAMHLAELAIAMRLGYFQDLVFVKHDFRVDARPIRISLADTIQSVDHILWHFSHRHTDRLSTLIESLIDDGRVKNGVLNDLSKNSDGVHVIYIYIYMIYEQKSCGCMS